MKLWKRKKLINWHKKTHIELLPFRWAISILLGIVVIGIVYFFVSLGSLRFFLGNYFSIAGFNKNYLVVLQNQYELRPTGGFISAYGILKFRFFVPTSFDIEDSFKVTTPEYVNPPEVLGKLLADPWYQGHTFRDANWNPDFPQSAQELIDFYNQYDSSTEINGVIGVNYKVIENLVTKFSPLNIQNQEITGKNLFHFLEYETKNVDKHDEESLGDRKNVLKDLGKSLIRKSLLHIPTVAQVFNQALTEKDVQMWFKADNLEEKIWDKKWGGAFQGNDYTDNLGVNFANLGAKKADRYVQRSVDYTVTFMENQAPQADLKITMSHDGDYSLFSDRYKGYLRIYIPTEAKYQASKEQDISQENGFQVVGQEILLEPGETKVFEIKYVLLSNVINKNKYFLNLIKQSGADVAYNVVLKVPGDMSFDSQNFDVRENRAFYHDNSAQDKNFIVTLLPDKTPPLVYEQKFDELNQLAIIFNEKLDSLNANEKANFEISDSNEINPTDDKITIKKVAYDGDKIIRIFTEGITKQNLERYKITLKNIQDKAGNAIMPSPMIVTAVQRFDK